MITSLTLAWRSSHSDSVLRARRNLAAQDAAAKKNDLAPKTTDAAAPAAPAAGAASSAPAKQDAKPAPAKKPAEAPKK
jgi:hypothetical protein